jgi:hypothetical protein
MNPLNRLFALGFLTTSFALRVLAGEPNTLTAAEKSTGWQLLFDGKTLDGWKANENPETFTAADGAVVVFGKRSHLFYAGPVAGARFKNFELELEIMTFPKANSGVYFHTEFQESGWPAKGYEVQVNNSHTDPKRGGGLYAVQDNMTAPAKDEEWYTMRIKVEGRRIQTFVNGKQLVDYTEEDKPTRRPDMSGRLLSNGTFALQGHDPASKVLYRNIKVRVLPD